jgi:hypothetical protein
MDIIRSGSIEDNIDTTQVISLTLKYLCDNKNGFYSVRVNYNDDENCCYILRNKFKWLNRCFPNVERIELQHSDCKILLPKFPKLQTLITNVDCEIGNNKTIETLIVNNNIIPRDLYKCKNVKRLAIYVNSKDDLKIIELLSNLEYLAIYFNIFLSIPKFNIGSLREIRSNRKSMFYNIKIYQKNGPFFEDGIYY